MRKMLKKRILALILAATLLVSPVSTYAATEISTEQNLAVGSTDSGQPDNEVESTESNVLDSGVPGQILGPYPPRWNIGDEVEGFGTVTAVEWLEEDEIYFYSATHGYWFGEEDPLEAAKRNSAALRASQKTPRAATPRYGDNYDLVANIGTTQTYYFPSAGKYQISMYGPGGRGGNGGPRKSGNISATCSPGGGGGASGGYQLVELYMEAGSNAQVTVTATQTVVRLSTGQTYTLTAGASGLSASSSSAGTGAAAAGAPNGVSGQSGGIKPPGVPGACNLQGNYCMSAAFSNDGYHGCGSYGGGTSYGWFFWKGGKGGTGGQLPHPSYGNQTYGNGGNGGSGGEYERDQYPGDRPTTTYTAGDTGNSGGSGGVIIGRSTVVPTPTNPTLTKNPNKEWHNGNVEVTLSGSVAPYGTINYQYRINNGGWINGSKVVFSQPGVFQVDGRAYVNPNYPSGISSIEVKIDTTAPTVPLISKNPNTTWANGNVTITLAGSRDEGGSSLAGYEYRIGEAGVWTNTNNTPFTVSKTCMIYGRAYDNAGNYSAASSIAVNIEGPGTAPILTKTPNTKWANVDVVVRLTGGNAASGIAKHQYRIDGGAWVDGNMVTVTRTCTVYGRAVSNAGGVSPESNIDVNIDKIAPTKPAMSKNPNTEWARGDVVVTLSNSTDEGGSGFAGYQYRIGEAGTWTNYDKPVTVSETCTVYGRAYDNAGNYSDGNSISVQIEEAVPIAPKMSKNPNMDWANSNVVVTLTGGSAASGIAKYQYRIDDGAWIDGDKVTVSATHTVFGRVVSNANGVSPESSIDVMIDKIAPTKPAISKNPNAEWVNGSVVVTLYDSTDEGGSGFANYQYRINDGAWTDGNPVTISETCTIYGRAVDKAGNTSDDNSIEVKCDAIAPTGTITASTTSWTNRPVTLTFSATDAGGSGVKQVRFADGSWVNGSTIAHEVTTNGTYSFEVMDYAQNSAIVSYTVSNIDTLVPVITAITFTETENELLNHVLGTKQMEISISAADTGGSGVAKIEYQMVFEDGEIKELGWVVYNDSNRPRIKESFNGFVYARCTDAASNLSAVLKSEEIFVVKNPPAMTHILRPGKDPITNEYPWTNEAVEIEVQARTISGGALVESIIMPNGQKVTGSSCTYKATQNGTYLFKVLDKGRNVTPYTVEVTNIEKDLPEIENVKISDPDANGKVTITLIARDATSGVRAILLPTNKRVDGNTAQCVVTSNGKYQFIIYDNAWNERIHLVEVTNIR